MVDIQDPAAFISVPKDSSGGPSMGSQQGQKRTQVIESISELSADPFQALSLENQQLREFGGDKNPGEVVVVGGKEINTAESTKAPNIPEVGKGSIADIVL